MTKVTLANRLHGKTVEQHYAGPEVALDTFTEKNLAKPARINRSQLGHVLSVLQRVAAGGDITCTVDAAACVPLLQRAIHAAPRGARSARAQYRVTLPDDTCHTLHGLRAVCKLIGRANSTVANALSKGKGAAEFPSRDEHGNPAAVRVEKIVPV